MADQEHMAAEALVAHRLLVHLGDQRAGRVEVEEVARLGVGRHGFRHAVGREDDRARLMLRRDFGQFLDEDGAEFLQTLDHVAVVHDLVADIDRRAVFLQRQHDDLDRAVDAGAEAARLAEPDGQRRFCGSVEHDAEMASGDGHVKGKGEIRSRRFSTPRCGAGDEPRSQGASGGREGSALNHLCVARSHRPPAGRSRSATRTLPARVATVQARSVAWSCFSSLSAPFAVKSPEAGAWPCLHANQWLMSRAPRAISGHLSASRHAHRLACRIRTPRRTLRPAV